MSGDTGLRSVARVISFGEGGGNPGEISFNVPLPGYQTGRRFIRLNLGLKSTDWQGAARNAGEDLSKTIKLKLKDDRSGYSFDPIAAAELFRQKLYESGATAMELAALDEAIAALRLALADGTLRSARDARETIQQVTSAQISARTASASNTIVGIPRMQASPVAALGSTGLPPRPTPGNGSIQVPAPGPVPHPGPGGGSSSSNQPPPLLPQLRDLFAALETGIFLSPKKSWTGMIELVPIRAAVSQTQRSF
jgi:hypothetical protein